jgi:hypothetical protein
MDLIDHQIPSTVYEKMMAEVDRVLSILDGGLGIRNGKGADR